MDIGELVMVSVDDHVVEPPHLFEGRLPATYAGRDACTVGALRARSAGHDISVRSQLRDRGAAGGTLASDLESAVGTSAG